MSVSAFEHCSSQNRKKLHPVESSKNNNVQTLMQKYQTVKLEKLSCQMVTCLNLYKVNTSYLSFANNWSKPSTLFKWI